MQIRQERAMAIYVATLVFFQGCTTVAVRDPEDPWESWNRSVQSFNDDVDDYVMKPLARGYRWLAPDFVDKGISNFFGNITDVRVTINDALQGKFAQCAADGSRLFLNTTFGIGGFLDVASNVDLPKHNEDFDQTLAVWGIPSGPYLVLPFLGPSSPRGVFGVAGDVAANPISYTGVYFGSSATSMAVSTGLGVTNAVDLRADNLEAERIATEAAIDRYAFFRGAYLSQRNYLIHDGNVPADDLLDLDEEEQSLSPLKPY
jgi:phospholipid-binding lipoprotein MlaA